MAVRTLQERAVAELELAAETARHSVAVAVFAGLDPDGRFTVRFSDGDEPVPAVSTVALTATDTGARVVVAFDRGDPQGPIIIGRAMERSESSRRTVIVDGERLVLRAGREIEIRCGDASIVLTKAGKVLIKGTFVLSRSRGANKIKGAHVAIN
jgi:hypothetical protein